MFINVNNVSPLNGFFFMVVYFPLRTLIVTLLATFWTNHSHFAQKRRIYRLAVPKTQTQKEAWSAVQIALLDAVGVAILHRLDVFRQAPPTWLNVLVTVVALFVWVEFVYYFFHRAMHTTWLRVIHRQHHTAKVTQPLTFLSFSIAERSLQGVFGIGTAALFSHFFTPIPLEGVIGYAILFVLLDLKGHLNVEIYPAGFSRTLLGKILFTPTYHAMHHARLTGHYGLYSPLMDHLFGTVYSDYDQVQTRAAHGVGLESLDEKGTLRHA